MGSFPSPHQQDPSGTFVQLRVNLVQTNCRKRAQRTHNCKAVENRVRFVGLAPKTTP